MAITDVLEDEPNSYARQFTPRTTDEFEDFEKVFQEADPFNKTWKEIKEYRGLDDSNARRKITRKANSAYATQVSPQYEEQSMMQPGAVEGPVQSKQINPGKDYMNGYGAFDVITPPYNLYQLASFYDSNYVNHAACDAKVLNMIGGGYRFDMTSKARQRMLEGSDADKIDKMNKKIDAATVATIDWLENMNDQDSFIDTMTKVMTDYESTGNGYLEIGRTTGGQIGYIGHIPSTTMRVRRLRDGYVQIINQKVVYFRNFGAENPDPFGGDPQPNEIIHFKKYSPLNTYYGVPDIVAAMPSLIGDQMAERYNIDYFENKAVPRYLIWTKGVKLTADSEDRLFRFLQTNLKGQNHRTLYVPLPGDTDQNKVEFKMEPIENKVQEASFKEYRAANRNSILMAHQVPLSKLGSSDGGGAIAAALSQDRTFRDQVCRPVQQRLEKAISFIVKEFTDMIELKFNEMNIIDEVQQSTMHKTYGDLGAMRPNEIRAAIGLPAIKGLDEKIDEQKNPPKPDPNADPNSVQDRNNQRTQNASDKPGAAQGRNPKGSGAKEDGNKA